MKIWIYVCETTNPKQVVQQLTARRGRFIQIERDSPKLTWGGCPADTVRYTPRLNGKAWSYVEYGDTQQACEARVNRFTIQDIEDLEAKVLAAHRKLVSFPHKPACASCDGRSHCTC